MYLQLSRFLIVEAPLYLHLSVYADRVSNGLEEHANALEMRDPLYSTCTIEQVYLDLYLDDSYCLKLALTMHGIVLTQSHINAC